MLLCKKISCVCFLTIFSFLKMNAQCCAAGSGSPIAGDGSQGVLQKDQAELNLNYQNVYSTKFLSGDTADVNYLDKYSSNYLYLRLAYGVSENLTISLESGYYIDKSQVGLDKRDTITASGLADIVIFPRYNIYNHTGERSNTDVTIGLGWKIPIGSHDDSLRQIEPFSGDVYYIRKPPAVQLSSGSNDFIFYGFLFHGYPAKKVNFFSNLTYIHKGWNSLGEKNGDYASLGLYAGKTVFDNFGLILQMRGEWIDEMKVNPDLYLYGYYNYSTTSTGSKKIFVTPQITYSKKQFIIYALSEFPIYQYVNGTQIASQYLITAGISYRFLPFSKLAPPIIDNIK